METVDTWRILLDSSRVFCARVGSERCHTVLIRICEKGFKILDLRIFLFFWWGGGCLNTNIKK